mmetsp:Transcript_37692/g.99613  ORF Transcript_37692/g.99613 Transcript_37692/m.99613 type:complete len:158 (-) Transcript_37692:344-817(-)
MRGPNMLISVVYYPKVPEGTAATPSSQSAAAAPLLFANPVSHSSDDADGQPASNAHCAPDQGLDFMISPVQLPMGESGERIFGNLRFSPNSGDIVVFHNSVWHGVPPLLGDAASGTRVAFAANIRVRAEVREKVNDILRSGGYHFADFIEQGPDSIP